MFSPFAPLRRNASLALVVLSAGIAALSQAQTIRPLAGDPDILAESPDPQQIPLFTPSILRTTSGRLVAAYSRGGEGRSQGQDYAFILTSDDGGKTWTQRASTQINQARLFEAGDSLYYLGQQGNLRVIRSQDDGNTWSEIATLTNGQKWHQSACNVWHARGNVYLVMEKQTDPANKGWPVGGLAPVLMRAKESADLTEPENWTFASTLPFCDVIPGYKDNDLQINMFGVPFYRQEYPLRATIHPDCKETMSPLGWLESNVVQILDPNHYWFDPAGRTFHLFMRANTGGTGYAALAKVVENNDGSMTTSLEKVPSGKTALFLPFPGGHLRFHVLYDTKTELYWLLGSQPTDSMTRLEKLPGDRFSLPNNERHRLVLHFSKNMVDWCFAGVVDIGKTAKEARHYASMDIDGDDLVILSRSGDENAKSAHNGNIITFHRVKNFRDLVY